LDRRRVADAHVAVAAEARQMRQEALFEIAGAVDRVDRLQGAGFCDVAQIGQEAFALLQVRKAP
jgi:hypothetical protein